MKPCIEKEQNGEKQEQAKLKGLLSLPVNIQVHWLAILNLLHTTQQLG